VDTCVVTDSLAVIDALRQVVGANLIRADRNKPLPNADLYIWDVDDSAADIPLSFLKMNEPHRLILLLEDSQTNFIHLNQDLAACVLIKPLNPFTLRAFVELASETLQLREQACRLTEVASDRDGLVHYVLAANLKLQEYDHQRTNFLARALHDFRAPLTALHGYCGLFADGHLGPISPSQRDLLIRMQTSTKRLSKQASGMFELSVMGHVRRKPQLTSGDIEGAIAQALHDVYPLLQEKDITTEMEVDPPETLFLFEPEQITQVLVNLLENSCKFTPAGGRIQIRGYSYDWNFDSSPREVSGDTSQSVMAYRIDIQDTGPGIQPHLLSTIFEQYTSYCGGRDRSGGGLGLAISKMIVGAHQGFIWAANSDTGAVFSIVLPLQPFSVSITPDVQSEVALPNR
jgi:signal transduction histidine kinase